MKLKLTLISIFIIAYAIFYSLNFSSTDERINQILNEQINTLQTHYNLTKNYFLTDAKSISNNVQANKEVIEIFTQAQNTTDKQRDILRNKLFKLLHPMYKRLQSRGILQFQFVFKDNISFLRLHKKNKYGDDLTDIRYSFKYTNEHQEHIEGFEQGKTTNAFRYTFPFYDKEHNHIGAVEISLSSYAVQEKLLHVNKIHSHFLVKKDVFDVKAWKNDIFKSKYMPSIENNHYMFSMTKHTNLDKTRKDEVNLIALIKKDIAKGMLQEKAFALYAPYKKSVKIIAFIPIRNIKERKIVAYIVSYTYSDSIKYILRNSRIANIVIFIGLLLLFYFIYKNLNRKKELQLEVTKKTNMLNELNENLEHTVEEKTQNLNEKNNELNSLLSSYDKNVMYSSTDLNGIITDVSEAFCKESGYSREELIGVNHNIVRHPENPSDGYENLWKRLQNKESFSSEVKNLKKNGEAFWVKSFFSPEYDKKGVHIGYRAVRDNISDRKEVEALQEEIEETQKEVIFKMGSIGETRSRETGYHVRRVAEYSKHFALHYGLSEEDAKLLKQASPMHDIGKVAIPDDILNKPAKLTDNEMQIMKTHSQLGFDMLHGSSRPLLNTAAIIAHEHHEKWDGSGYPQGLTALEIHVYGRITAIADVFDALGSDRCYKKAWDDERIFEFFKAQRGKHFEPKLVDIFFDNLDEFLAIRNNLVDKK